MLARIRVTRRSVGTVEAAEYNFTTGQYSNVVSPVVFEGLARIQPYGIIGDQIVGQDPTGRRLMRVQIKNKETGVRLDDQLSILECKDDPEMLNFSLEVRGSIGSSNAWLTDLVCEANLKWVNDVP